jgi:hypothetical protein
MAFISSRKNLNETGFYLDQKIVATDSGVVHKFGNELISGVKTFVNNLEIQGTGIFNALDLSNIGQFQFSGTDINLINGNVNISGGTLYISGNAVLTGVNLNAYATTANLYATGSTLDSKINSLSGYVTGITVTLPTTIVYTTGNQTISGNKSFNNTLSVGTISGLIMPYPTPSIKIKASDNATDYGGVFAGGNMELIGGSGDAGGGNVSMLGGDSPNQKYNGSINLIGNRIDINNNNTSSRTVTFYKTGASTTEQNLVINQNSIDVNNNFKISGVLVVPNSYATKSNGQFTNLPSVNGTGILLSGQNSFIITLYNTSDTQGAGHNYFGNIAAGFNATAGGVNRRFPVLESCVVKKASWTQYNQIIGSPSLNSTGYFINTTTNTTGTISTIINTQSTSSVTNYTAEFSPPIAISTGDYIVCSLFGPTYATTYPASVRNTVNLYCYN